MFEHNVRAALIGIGILCALAAHTSAQTPGLQLRKNADLGGVSVVYNGRLIHTYPGDESSGTEESKGIFLIGVGNRGGNGCFPSLVVVDTNRSPPFASDIFGGCGADIVVSAPGYLALMIRSDGSHPDDVWFYDGQRVQKLPQRTREQYISRGEAARAAHHYAEAVREFLAVADLGDPRGPSNLADMLLNGEGINSDLPMARDLFKRAAEMGQPFAMASLAEMLREGKGGEVDRGEALRWTQLAAARGEGLAQLQMGELLAAGAGLPSDDDAALMWYRLAESNLARTEKGTLARVAAERVAAKLDEERTAAVAAGVAAFRPVPAAPVWDLPADWAIWDGHFPSQRLRGGTIFEMPAFAAAVGGLLGARVYALLPTFSDGPARITVESDWVTVSGCQAHSCGLHGYFIALRRDGSDVAACVLDSSLPPNSQGAFSDYRRTLTFARVGALSRQVELSGPRVPLDYNTLLGLLESGNACPHDVQKLLAEVPRPARGAYVDRDRAATYAPWVPRAPNPPANVPPQSGPVRVAPGQPMGLGTAWRVDERRYITAEHVVERCGAVRLRASGQARSAFVMVHDDSADLALLESDLTTKAFLLLRETPPRPAEAVVVAGFPLQGVLASGPQVSTGIVTALAGLQDDPDMLQLSAPIQPGNSGGPVVDREGNAIAVARATISTLAATIATGAVPQNVNFATKIKKVSELLLSARIQPQFATPGETLSTEVVAGRALDAVALVECLK